VIIVTHENMTDPNDSNAEPDAQNTGNRGAARKKKGKIGKKNPTRMPCSTAGVSDARPLSEPLSKFSIHCSSRLRAYSSSEIPR
jgi:hypothetical protein